MNKFPLRSILLFLLLIPILSFSKEVTEGARTGLLLWYHSVVPALFPFMVISGLIISGGGIMHIMHPFYKILHPILGLSHEGCYVLISGLLCGYPMGAKTCAEFAADKRISFNEAKFLMTICNHPSPMFILGYVYPLFSEHITIVELLLTIYIPITVLAVIAKYRYPFDEKHPSFDHQLQKNHAAVSMDETILSSIEVLCKIGGYLVLFSIMIKLIHKCSFLTESLRLCFIGLIEMTTGIQEFANIQNWKIGYFASAASLTFGGLSGIFQTKSVLEHKKEAGLSVRPYILWKSAHAVLASGLAYLLCNVD